MNKKLFHPIFYALVLIIGILLGQNFVINYSNLGFFDFFSKNGEKINTPAAYQSNNKINAIVSVKKPGINNNNPQIKFMIPDNTSSSGFMPLITLFCISATYFHVSCLSK